MDTLSLCPERCQSVSSLYLDASDMSSKLDGHLFCHQNNQIGAGLGCRKQGKPGVGIVCYRCFARDVTDDVKDGACIHAQHWRV